MSLLDYVEYGFLKYISNYVKNHTTEESYALAYKLGKIAYSLDKKHREIAKENLLKSFENEKTQEEIEKIVFNNFINIAYLGIEFFLPTIDEKFLKENVTIQGIEHFEEALDQRKGIINITGHLGNWEIMGAIFTALGYKVSALAKKQSNKIVDKFVLLQRQDRKLNIIYLKEANRRALTCLRDNNILVILADQDARDNGIFVNFFGRPASTYRGPAVLHRKTDAPVIMSFLIREKPGKFKLIIEKPLIFVKTENKDQDVLSNSTLWSSQMESYIRKYPDQWFWVHRRWKTKK